MKMKKKFGTGFNRQSNKILKINKNQSSALNKTPPKIEKGKSRLRVKSVKVVSFKLKTVVER